MNFARVAIVLYPDFQIIMWTLCQYGCIGKYKIIAILNYSFIYGNFDIYSKVGLLNAMSIYFYKYSS